MHTVAKLWKPDILPLFSANFTVSALPYILPLRGRVVNHSSVILLKCAGFIPKKSVRLHYLSLTFAVSACTIDSV